MVEEKIISINIRQKLLKEPHWERGKKAVRYLREELKRISKSEDIKIGERLNKKLWMGIGKLPNKIKVRVTKDDKEKTAKVELVE